MDKAEQTLYETVRRELEYLRKLAAEHEEGSSLLEAMEEAAGRAEQLGREARFLQLDELADRAERLAVQARAVRGHDSLGSFLETLFSFHDLLPPGTDDRGGEEPTGLEHPGAGGYGDSGEAGVAIGGLRRSGASSRLLELEFSTPPQELFELNILERKLIIDALDQSERVYAIHLRGRSGASTVLLDLLYRLEETVNVVKAITPENGGRPGRIDALCASPLPREQINPILSDPSVQEARISEVPHDRLSLSVARQDLRISRGLLAGLSEVELRLGSDEYERYTLLREQLSRELGALVSSGLPKELAETVERLDRLYHALGEDLSLRSRWRVPELAYRLALWLEHEAALKQPLRLSVEGGDWESLESPVAQLMERALRGVAAQLLEITAAEGELARREFLFETESGEQFITIWLTPVSPALLSSEALESRLASSEVGYVIRDLLSGSLTVTDRRGSEGVGVTVPRGGQTVTVLICERAGSPVAFPAALVVEAQSLFSRMVAHAADGRIFMRFRGSNLPLYTSEGTEITDEATPEEGFGVVLRVGERRIAVLVDHLVSQESVILTDSSSETVFVESQERRIPFFLPLELF